MLHIGLDWDKIMKLGMMMGQTKNSLLSFISELTEEKIEVDNQLNANF